MLLPLFMSLLCDVKCLDDRHNDDTLRFYATENIFFCLNGKMLCKQVATLEIAFLKYFAAFMII